MAQQSISLQKYASHSMINLLDTISADVKEFSNRNYKPISISHTIYTNNDRHLVYSAIVMYELVSVQHRYNPPQNVDLW